MSLDLTYNFWFLICAGLVIIAFTLWIYRTTLPEVSPFLRRTLLLVRILLLLIIVLLLLEGQIRILVEKIKKPVFLVLLDTSASMQLQDNAKSRNQQALELLRPMIEHTDLTTKSNLQLFSFSDSIAAIDRRQIDALKFDGDGTNLSLALQQASNTLAEEKIASVLLITDGASNLGADPLATAEKFPAPIYSVPIGADSVAKDLWIKDIVTNKTAFADAEIPVELYIRAQGLSGAPAQIQILQDNRILQDVKIATPGDGLEYKATLFIKPTGLGKQKFTAIVSETAGEITGRNNVRSFYLNVRKSKLNILLLAAAPSPDVAFIRQALENEKNFSLKQIIAVTDRQLTGDALPKDSEIKDIDCVIAINFARKSIHPTLQNFLLAAANTHAKPLLFLSGHIESSKPVSSFSTFLKVAGSPQIGREHQVQVRLNHKGALHPVFKTGAGAALAQLDALPPVFSQIKTIKFQPGTDILATAGAARRHPTTNKIEEPAMVAVTKFNNQRVISIWANGIWRWKLLLQNDGQSQSFYENFVQNCIRWLAARDENKLLDVKPSGDIFRAGEQIQFIAQAYFDDYRVREHLQISLDIEGAQGGHFAFTEQGNGFYRCSSGILPAGDYRYFSQARENGAVVSADSGKFSVIPFQWELQNVSANREILMRLAGTTGGKIVTPDSLESWLAGLEFVPEKRHEFYEIKLWQHWSLFITLIALLALEWFIRKQKGML